MPKWDLYFLFFPLGSPGGNSKIVQLVHTTTCECVSFVTLVTWYITPTFGSSMFPPRLLQLLHFVRSQENVRPRAFGIYYVYISKESNVWNVLSAGRICRVWSWWDSSSPQVHRMAFIRFFQNKQQLSPFLNSSCTLHNCVVSRPWICEKNDSIVFECVSPCVQSHNSSIQFN